MIGDVTDTSSQAAILELLQDGRKVDGTPLPEIGDDEARLFNTIVSDISPRLTGQYDRDQAISLELVAMVFDFTLPLLAPGGAFVTKIFQGVGIEGLVDAAKDRFSNVQRFSPTASRSSSSETYLICQNKLQRVRTAARGKTALEQVNQHLSRLGILVEESDEDEETVVGFRRLNKDSD